MPGPSCTWRCAFNHLTQGGGRTTGGSHQQQQELSRFCYPGTSRIMESRNVTFIDAHWRLLPPPPEVISTQTASSSNGMDDHNNITDSKCLRNLRDYTYTSVLKPLPGASADRKAVGGFSADPPAAELLERISEITRRDILVGGDSGPQLEGAMPRRMPTEGGSQVSAVQLLEQPGVSCGSFPRNTTGRMTAASATG